MKRISIIILFLLILANAIAQSDEPRFTTIRGPRGESLGKITEITQDPSGYLWFSGQDEQCIYRYDGIHTTAFRHDDDNLNSLGGVSPETIYADKQGMVWIGFGDRGLDRFDPITGTFTHYQHDANDPSSLSHNAVSVILEDRKGNLWIGTEKGLDKLDETTGKFGHYVNDKDDPKSLSDNCVRAIYEDRDGVLWIGTGFPWFKIAPESGGLNRMESDGTFTRFMNDPKNPNTLINNKVRSIFEDSRGVLWVGTSGDGLHTMDKKTGYVIRHQYDPKHPNKLSRPPLQKDDWRNYNDQVTFIEEDLNGGIWIGSMWSGINHYDPLTNLMTHYGADKNFSDNSGWNAKLSKDGVLWISTQEGNLFQVEMISKAVKEVVLEIGSGKNRTTAAVHRYIKDDDKYWVATEQGLFLLNEKKQVLNHFFIENETQNSGANNLISLFQTQKDTLWIGTQAGLFIFDKRTETFSPFLLPDSVKNESIGRVISIIQDHNNIIWITSADGLISVNSRGKLLEWYRHDDKDPESISTNDLVCLLDDMAGSLWVGTDGGGLNRLNIETGKFRHYMGKAKFVTLFIDSNNDFWVGTSNGLFLYNKSTDEFSPFGSGSIINIDRIYGILEDEQKNLWITTQNQLTRVNSTHDEVVSFGKLLGIRQLSPGALFRNPSGEVFIGYAEGFLTFFPNEFVTENNQPDILVTDVLVNNKPVQQNGKSSGYDFGSVSNDGLQLEYNENNLVFKYALNDYRGRDAIQYLTRLAGLEESWRESSADKTSYYTNIPPGDYVFQIKVFNLLGNKSEKSIPVHIAPPLWKTNLAYGSYFLFGIFLLWYGRREIVRRERLKTAFTVKQMELDSVREVDKTKSTFFTNISHEFRTPLTLIKGHTAELLEENKNHKKTRDRLKLIDINSDHLLKLINQLLELSKLESGTTVINKTKGDLNFFFTTQVSSFSSLANQKNISLLLRVEQLKYHALFDYEKLETILINLVNNAIKFTPSGGEVSINVSIDDSKENGPGKSGLLTITVKDSGIGIPADKLEKIFERFYRVNESHRETGTGIGLALVKELVEKMEGNVSVASQTDKGSEFSVTLPIELLPVTESISSNQVLTESLAVENPDHIVDSRENNTGKPKILVVEDNSDLSRLIVMTLGNEYECIEACDGLKGFETALREIPELIISDVMMPEMDGMAMTAKIKGDIRTSHIPVIILTAKAAEKNKIDGLSIGAIDYLTKPFNKKELKLKVLNIISFRQKLAKKMKLELLKEVPDLTVGSEDERFLQKLKEVILGHLSDEQLSVDSLAREVSFSRTQLYRKVSALTGKPVNELIRSFRLQRAAQLLAQRWGPVGQVAYEVGFSNPSYFTKCFKEEFGVMPSEYKAVDEKPQ